MEYELDVSKASSLRILLDRDGYSSYAIGNLSVDGEKVAAPSVPTYECTDDFLHRGFALYQTSFGNTTVKEPSYNMNGRGFFDGIMFKNTYEDAQVCYNVENVKSMSFTIGHIDNSDTKNAVLRIYLDNNSVLSTMPNPQGGQLSDYICVSRFIGSGNYTLSRFFVVSGM